MLFFCLHTNLYTNLYTFLYLKEDILLDLIDFTVVNIVDSSPSKMYKNYLELSNERNSCIESLLDLYEKKVHWLKDLHVYGIF